MKHLSTTRRMPRPPRGFTIVELLVVIGIIIFLIGISVNVVTNAITAAKEKRTIATIRKVSGLLTQRMDAFTIAMNAQDLSNPPEYVSNRLLFPTSIYPFLSANVSPQQLAQGNLNRAKALGRKALFRTYFPQSIEEVLDASVLTDRIPANNVPGTESSEALYLFLTKMESFDHPAVDESAFDSQEVDDTDNDGLKEFVDGWGQPLRFYRWPTRLIRPGNPSTAAQTVTSGSYTIPVVGNPPTAYFMKPGHDASIFFGSLPKNADQQKDPDDSLGTILVTTWGNWKYYDGSTQQMMTPAVFENAPDHPSTPGFGLSTPETWSMPLIVSAGPDGKWGLHDMNDSANYGHLAQPNSADLDGLLDNLSNRNIAP